MPEPLQTVATAATVPAPKTGAAYLLTFLFTLSATPAIYVNSTYLAGFFGEAAVSWLYAVGSLLGIVGLSFGYRAARRFGNAAAFSVVVLAALLGSAAMAIDGNPWLAGGGFLLTFAAGVVAYFQIDIFLESATRNGETGTVRGWNLTFANVAYIAGTILASFLLYDGRFWRIFAFGGLMLALVWLFVRRRFRDFRDPDYREGGIVEGLRVILTRWNARKAFACVLTLHLFYAWMIIYLPLHLTGTVGFTPGQVTAMMAIALLPFLLLQEWVGRLADCCTGEKEFLATGLTVMGLSTLAIPLLSTASFPLWAAVLFMTRVGAALVEAMVNSYLFKKIDAADAGAMQLFHTVRPAATIAAPVLGVAVIALAGVPALFAVLGVACFATLYPALRLRDTK